MGEIFAVGDRIERWGNNYGGPAPATKHTGTVPRRLRLQGATKLGRPCVIWPPAASRLANDNVP